MVLLRLLLIASIATLSKCANVLVVIPFTSKSHNILLRPIGLELARKGHNVTVITPFSEMNPPDNYHEVIVNSTEVWTMMGEKRQKAFDIIDATEEESHKMIWTLIPILTEFSLSSDEIQEFLRANNKFDLVICEQFFQEAFYIFAHKYQAPLILITTWGNCMKCNIALRNPLQLSYVLHDFLRVNDPKSFWGRLRNWYFTMYEYFWWKYSFLPKNEQLIAKYVPNLPQPVPSLYDIQRNVSLILINSHFSYDPPTAYLPNIVEIGGLHLSKNDEKLPKDLQTIFDNAKHGVVYFNLGSNVQSSDLPLEKREAFVKVFSELKQTVLWKFEDDTLTNIPGNVVIRKWLPQKQILAHPNIKVFISHGGMIGTMEAVFNGVPILGIPIYSDQYNNLLQAQYLGFGKILEYKDINEETIRSNINEMISNSSFEDNAREVSRRFSDRPMTALDTAVFWIEYVIRHKGADFIKNTALSMSWIEANMIDVYCLVLSIVLVPLFVVYKILEPLGLSRRRTEHVLKKKVN